MRNVQKGFTLIELMIVVAIIGILAAIAIPQYQDYITRAKWQDNISQVQSWKTAVAECLQNNNGTIGECDSQTEVTSATGAAFPTATGNAASIAYGATGIVVTGTASVGACVVTVAPSASGTSVSWNITTGTTPATCTKAKTGFVVS
ncbi:MAG: prepilin-type N-terminal cleavage/methylation domain-containing protein [Burkholderiales bacterium]